MKNTFTISFYKQSGLGVLIAFLIFGLYAQALKDPFVWDDSYLVTQNAFIKEPGHLKDIFTSSLNYFIPTFSAPVFYRPFQALSYCFDYRLWGLNPFGYHLTNIFLHLANTLLVYALLKAFFHQRRAALVAALLFGVCPLNVSAVTYISGRADLLALFFICSSLIAFLAFLRTAQRWKYVFSLLCFVGALLSKEVALIFPCLLILTAYAAMKQGEVSPVKKRAVYYAGFFVIAFFYLVFRALFFRLLFTEHTFGTGVGSFVSLLVFCKIIFSYFLLIVRPDNLHMQRLLPNVSPAFTFCSLVFVLFFALAIICSAQKRMKIFWGLAWFALALIPVYFLMFSYRDIVPSSVMMAEHWLYIPLVGFFAVLAYVATRPAGSFGKILINVCLSLFVLVYSFQLVRYNRDWVDNEHILAATVKNEPSHVMAKYYLASTHVEMGLFKVAADEFNALLLLQDTESYRAHEGLGNIAFMKSDFEGALNEYDKALKDISALKNTQVLLTDQKNSRLLRLRGTVYFNQGLYEDARRDFLKSIESNNRNFASFMALGVLYAAEKKFDQSIQYFQKSLDIFPYNADVYQYLTRVYADKGDIEHSKQAQEKLRALRR